MSKNEGVIFTRNASGLVRELSWFDVFVFVVAGPAASGVVYFSVSTAADYPGANLPLAFLLGLALFAPICLLVALTSATMPRSGGLYVAVSRVLGPTMGFLSAWLLFIGNGIGSGALGYIVVGMIGAACSTAAISSEVAWLASVGHVLQTTLAQIIGGIIWLVGFWAIALYGIRKIKILMRIAFVIPMVATVVAVVWFFFAGDISSVAESFNATWGAGAFEAIKAKAAELAAIEGFNMSPDFSMTATMNAFLVVIWAYASITIVNYASGEVKTPKNSLVRGFMIGTFFVGIFYVVIVFATYNAFGDFIMHYDYLFDNHPEQLAAILGAESAVEPSVPFYFMAIAGNVWFGLLIAVSIALWFANSILPGFLANSRVAFALSMDKSLPKAFSDVDRRTGSPRNAVHLYALFMLLGVFVMSLSVQEILGILTVTLFFIFWPYGLATMLLPYHKPEIYDRSPVKWEIFGVPLFSILGMFTFLVGWFFIYLSLKDFSMSTAITLFAVMGIGMVIYAAKQNQNKKEGVDVDKIYSLVPPE
ncbi:MAG: APC family permease [Planctomycetota bacterium]|nr:APC family permease [Planctomycetota bacterium]